MAQYFEQSGVIPYRIQDGKVEILLITSRKKKRWVIPKGLVETEMSSQDSAAKEAWEEAGIIGEVLPDLVGTYQYKKCGGICQVDVFLLRVERLLDEWLESDREREWLSVKEAVKRLREKALKRIIQELPEQLLSRQ
ncbi:MAG: NUDIX hydrolase [Halothece sp.]